MEGVNEEFIEKVFNDMVRNTKIVKDIDPDDYSISIRSVEIPLVFDEDTSESMVYAWKVVHGPRKFDGRRNKRIRYLRSTFINLYGCNNKEIIILMDKYRKHVVGLFDYKSPKERGLF